MRSSACKDTWPYCLTLGDLDYPVLGRKSAVVGDGPDAAVVVVVVGSWLDLDLGDQTGRRGLNVSGDDGEQW
jgi:hypothetical protein